MLALFKLYFLSHKRSVQRKDLSYQLTLFAERVFHAQRPESQSVMDERDGGTFSEPCVLASSSGNISFRQLPRWLVRLIIISGKRHRRRSSIQEKPEMA